MTIATGNLRIKKGLRGTSPLIVLGIPPPVPCSRRWKETPYFKVGSRCSCPHVLSEQACTIHTDLASLGDVIGSPKVGLCHEHRRG